MIYINITMLDVYIPITHDNSVVSRFHRIWYITHHGYNKHTEHNISYDKIERIYLSVVLNFILKQLHYFQVEKLI